MKSRLQSSRWNLIAALSMFLWFLIPVLPASAQQQCNPVINIDTPPPNATVQGQITVFGWGADLNASDGSGMSDFRVVRDGLLGSGGVTVGSAQDVARPDVLLVTGHAGAGFSLGVDTTNWTPGTHTVNVYGTTSCGPAYASVTITVQPSSLTIEAPTANATFGNGATLTIAGWTTGTRVDVYLDGPANQGQGIASTSPGIARPDVVQSTGRQELANSGFSTQWVVNTTAGNHTLYVYALVNGQWTFQTVRFNVTGTPTGNGGLVVRIQSPASGSTISGSRLISGVAVDCAARAPASSVVIYRGGANGTQLGNAQVGTLTDISQVCGGASGQVPAGWTFTLNTISLGDGSQQITAVATFTNGGNAQDSATFMVANYNSGIYNGGVYNNGNCNGYSGMYNTGYYGSNIYNNGYYGSNIYNGGLYNGGVYNSGLYNGNCNGVYNGACNTGIYNTGYYGSNIYNGLYNGGLSNGGCYNSGYYGGLYSNIYGAACNPTFPTVNATYPGLGPCPGSVYCNGGTAYPSCFNGLGVCGTIYSTACLAGTNTPSGVTVTGNGGTSATVTWTAATNATSYTLFVCTSTSTASCTAVGPATAPVSAIISSTSAVVSGLTPGVTYYFGVSATGAFGTSGVVMSPAFVCCTGTGGGGLTTPNVTVIKNPGNVGGVGVGTCPSLIVSPAGCTVSFSWTEGVPATSQVLTGTGAAGTSVLGSGPSCSIGATTSPSCPLTFAQAPGTQIHWQASSTFSGSTLSTPDTTLTL